MRIEDYEIKTLLVAPDIQSQEYGFHIGFKTYLQSKEALVPAVLRESEQDLPELDDLDLVYLADAPVPLLAEFLTGFVLQKLAINVPENRIIRHVKAVTNIIPDIYAIAVARKDACEAVGQHEVETLYKSRSFPNRVVNLYASSAAVPIERLMTIPRIEYTPLQQQLILNEAYMRAEVLKQRPYLWFSGEHVADLTIPICAMVMEQELAVRKVLLDNPDLF